MVIRSLRTVQGPLAAGPAKLVLSKLWGTGLPRLLRPVWDRLERLVPVAGIRWAIEAVRGHGAGWAWTSMRCVKGWYRHITLSMLAHAYLAVFRNQATSVGQPEEKRAFLGGQRAETPDGL